MENEELFLTNCMIEHKNQILYMAEDIFSLLTFDVTNGGLRVLCKIKGFSVFYRSFAYYENKIYMFPESTGPICIYDINKNEYMYQKIPDNLHKGNENNWSANYIRIDNSLFFYWASPVITRYDLDTGEWRAYRPWEQELSTKIEDFKGFGTGAFFLNGNIYFHIIDTSVFVKINIKNDNICVDKIKFENNHTKVKKVLFSDNYIWAQVFEKEGLNIYKINSKSLIPEMKVTISLKGNGEQPSFIMEAFDEKVFLLPVRYNEAFEVDFKNNIYNSINEVGALNTECLKKAKKYPFNYYNGIKINNKWYSINLQSGNITIIDLKSGSVENKSVFSSNNQKRLFMKDMVENGNIKENKIMNLDIFLNLIDD